LERDLEVDPERAFVERLDDGFARELLDRELLDRELLDPDPERELLDFEPEPEPLDEGFARELLDRELLDPDPERELLARELELLDPLERLAPFELRELLDDDERRELDPPLRRSAAGISSLATAFASCGICFSRNLAMRSSSRRMPRASLAVSLSFTASASASMPV
jgi:hypothetical protein